MYINPVRIEAPDTALPAGIRIPFGWEARPVSEDPASLTKMYWSPGPAMISDAVRFRITVAADVRENKLIEAVALESERVLGSFDVRFPSVFYLLELPLCLNDALTVRREGLGLRMVQGKEPLWFFVPDESGGGCEPAFMPHFMLSSMCPDSRLASFKERFNSLASLQQFGWMEGCVLDGLMDLGYAETARKHLSMYLNEQRQLIYENPRSIPVDGQFYGIESILPIAILARIDPGHPVVAQALSYMESLIDPNGMIKDNNDLTAEGSYTIGYTIAVIARARHDVRLSRIALEQLSARRDLLWNQNQLFLRYYDDDGRRTFQNWGRAYVWYLLGMVRTIRELMLGGLLSEQDELEWKREFVRAMDIAWSYKDADGFWYGFVDERATGIDTSATAGIAAAAAIGVNMGYLGRELRTELGPILQSLLRFITPDGFLSGATQSNKDGEALQRSGYRVLSQMSMGLLAQFAAALEAEEDDANA